MNKYDDVHLNVPQLLKDQKRKLAAHDTIARSGEGLGLYGQMKSRLQLLFVRLLYKAVIYQKLIHSNLKLDWFYEFRNYWVNELGNRPIDPPDFYFLMCVYRQKFQDVEISNVASGDRILKTWQDPRIVYSLFHNQYKLALNPLSVRPFINYIPNEGNVCEYGCGLAPIATSLCRFYPHKNVRITCADIPTIMFHFTRWKFRNKKFIRTIEIDPGDDEPLDDEFDTIFCLEVLEHLLRPVPIIKHLHSRIRPGGYLIFNYVKTEGKGLDTTNALRDRGQVLRYILDNFRTVEGQIRLDGSDGGTAVCKKLRNPKKE